MIPIFLSALFGGMSPNLLSLAMKFQRGEPAPEITYYLGMCILGLMGAAVALIWKETDMKRAFYLGVGLPALIQVGVSNATVNDKPALALLGIRPALAQAVTLPTAKAPVVVFGTNLPAQPFKIESAQVKTNLLQAGISGKGTILRINPNPELDEYKIRFFTGQYEEMNSFQVKPSKTNVFWVPKNVDRIALTSGSADTYFRSIDPSDTVLEVGTAKKSWSGLKEAFGVQGVKEERFTVQSLKE